MENSEALALSQSASNDFYVQSECCISCGVPQAVAPDLVGWTDERMRQCYWKKQPSTPNEMQQAFALFDGQELLCHRYRGRDPDIQKRIGVESCDFPVTRPSIQSGVADVIHFASVEPPRLLSRIWSKIFRKD